MENKYHKPRHRLQHIGFDNFKGIRSADIELKPLTVVVGANSAGKTTLIQGITMIAQALRQRLYGNRYVLNGGWLKLGRFDEVKNHQSRASEPMRIRATTYWPESLAQRLKRNMSKDLVFDDEPALWFEPFEEQDGYEFKWEIELGANSQYGSESTGKVQSVFLDLTGVNLYQQFSFSREAFRNRFKAEERLNELLTDNEKQLLATFSTKLWLGGRFFLTKNNY